MLVIPAIDLMGGEAVRLEKGDFATKKVYAKDPAEKAAEFRDAGATLLHVVDLDGAKAGRPVNLDTVAKICGAKGIEIELGGGIRTLLDVEKVLALGVSYVVLGTAAVERLGLVEEACRKFPGRIRTGIDARDGEVKVSGWTAGTGLSAVEVARRGGGQVAEPPRRRRPGRGGRALRRAGRGRGHLPRHRRDAGEPRHARRPRDPHREAG